MSSVEQPPGLTAFVRSVQAGSFTAASRQLKTAPSAVSKNVARLEARLGVRLFQRSTRTLTLTREGEAYFERIEPLLRALDEASDAVRSPVAAKGLLRVSAPTVISHSLAVPITRRFVADHPLLKLEFSVTDRNVDLIREGYDVAIRVGRVSDSDLNARLLAEVPLVLVASPAYLAARGTPDSIQALSEHAHVRFLQDGRPFPILLADAPDLLVDSVLDTDSGDVLRIAALQGAGIVQLLCSAVQDDLARGELVAVLPKLRQPLVPIHALHAFGRHTPTRVRLFIDFLVACFATPLRA